MAGLLLDVGSWDNLGWEMEPLAEVVNSGVGQSVVVVLPSELGLDISPGVEGLECLDDIEVSGVDVRVLWEVEVLLGDENTLWRWVSWIVLMLSSAAPLPPYVPLLPNPPSSLLLLLLSPSNKQPSEYVHTSEEILVDLLAVGLRNKHVGGLEIGRFFSGVIDWRGGLALVCCFDMVILRLIAKFPLRVCA